MAENEKPKRENRKGGPRRRRPGFQMRISTKYAPRKAVEGQARSCIKEKTPVVAREPALVARLAVTQEMKRLNEPFKLRTQGRPP